MDTRSKPAWKEVPENVKNLWIKQTHDFYPTGSITLEEATELAQYEYEQSDSDSMMPPVESAA